VTITRRPSQARSMPPSRVNRLRGRERHGDHGVAHVGPRRSET
jgi:hypothetical protein